MGGVLLCVMFSLPFFSAGWLFAVIKKNVGESSDVEQKTSSISEIEGSDRVCIISLINRNRKHNLLRDNSPLRLQAHSYLLGGQLAQTANGGADSAAVGRAQRVGASGNSLCAGVAAPDADGLSAESELTAEGAEVLCVLGDLDLLGTLTGVSSVTRTIAAHDAHLDGTLGHLFGVGVLLWLLFWREEGKKKFARN